MQESLTRCGRRKNAECRTQLRSLRKLRRGLRALSWRAFRIVGWGEGQLRRWQVNAQNLRVVRNGFARGWTVRRPDSVGETPTGATETVALPFPSPRIRANGEGPEATEGTEGAEYQGLVVGLV